MEKIVVINPGSTSTKIAVYDDDRQIFVNSIEHADEELEKYEAIYDQYEFRKNLVLEELEKNGVKASDLTCIMSRGGLLPPVPAGAIRINQDMCDQLRLHPVNEHASNLGAPIAFSIAEENGIPAFIYDPVTVDEMIPLAKYTGIPEMRRRSLGHNLNMRAMAHRCAADNSRNFEDMTIITAHMGGGTTIGVYQGGKIIDIVTDEEGPFSPERAGGLPTPQVIDLAYSGEYDIRALKKKLKNSSGLQAYLGTKDARTVEKRMAEGDKNAGEVYQAMAYQISKAIGELATVVKGRVDAIVLTGGIAHSDLFTGWIRERVSFIAPVVIYPGENEMDALASGALRVLRGEEDAMKFEKNF